MTDGRNAASPRPRIGLVHALFESMAPIEAEFGESWPEAETLHLYDQSLYADFNKTRTLTPEIFRRVESLLRHSESTGARAILFTGSLFGDPVETAREKMNVPVLMAYEAMIEEAFASAKQPRLGLLATVASTVDMMTVDIKRYSDKHGIAYTLDARHVVGAIDALLGGDRGQHDRLVAEAAANLVDCDALMLGQFSMAPVIKQIDAAPGRRVLSSPGCAVAKMRTLISN